jgi:hypothetical protein
MTFEELTRHAATSDRSRKIVVCETGQGLRVEALVLRYGMDQWWTVHESPRVRPGAVLLINDPEEERS